MKQLLLLIVCVLVVSPGMSQAELIHRKVACQFTGGDEGQRFDEVEDVYGFASSEEAEAVVNRILSKVHSSIRKARFVIKSANVPNAEAIIDGEERIILYNSDFMLRAGEQDDWVAIFILAHEIAHHFLGHTLSKEGSRPAQELDADEWAGAIMCDMGANLDQAQAAIRSLVSDKPKLPGSTHPPKSARIEAVSSGFASAGCKFNGKPAMNPEFTKPDDLGPGLDPNYVNFKSEGDNAYKAGKWAVAKMNYQDALGYKPGDSYCTAQMKECEKQLALEKGRQDSIDQAAERLRDDSIAAIEKAARTKYVSDSVAAAIKGKKVKPYVKHIPQATTSFPANTPTQQSALVTDSLAAIEKAARTKYVSDSVAAAKKGKKMKPYVKHTPQATTSFPANTPTQQSALVADSLAAIEKAARDKFVADSVAAAKKGKKVKPYVKPEVPKATITTPPVNAIPKNPPRSSYPSAGQPDGNDNWKSPNLHWFNRPLDFHRTILFEGLRPLERLRSTAEVLDCFEKLSRSDWCRLPVATG